MKLKFNGIEVDPLIGAAPTTGESVRKDGYYFVLIENRMPGEGPHTDVAYYDSETNYFYCCRRGHIQVGDNRSAGRIIWVSEDTLQTI